MYTSPPLYLFNGIIIIKRKIITKAPHRSRPPIFVPSRPVMLLDIVQARFFFLLDLLASGCWVLGEPTTSCSLVFSTYCIFSTFASYRQSTTSPQATARIFPPQARPLFFFIVFFPYFPPDSPLVSSSKKTSISFCTSWRLCSCGNCVSSGFIPSCPPVYRDNRPGERRKFKNNCETKYGSLYSGNFLLLRYKVVRRLKACCRIYSSKKYGIILMNLAQGG